MEKVLVTGCSGFIGMHICKKLLGEGFKVCGIDNMSDYYSVDLKKTRLNILQKDRSFYFKQVDLLDKKSVEKVFYEFQPDKVINLAAQAGVRYSLDNPALYANTNINGFLNIMEAAKDFKVEGVVYASSSSVYGNNESVTLDEKAMLNKPSSIYSFTKISNELLAYTFNHLYGINVTGLRFFTVYGPWGRPDMAIYIFTKNIMQGKPIYLFNNGNHKRDFTYIDDIVNGSISAIKKNYANEVFNLGNNRSEKLGSVISIIENFLGKKAHIKFKKMQLGDIKNTLADISHAKKKLAYQPKTTIKEGIPKFIEWYKSYIDST